MIFFLKILSIGVKLFTKPVVAVIKKNVYKIKNKTLKNIFIRIGNKLHYYEFKINRKFLNLENKN